MASMNLSKAAILAPLLESECPPPLSFRQDIPDVMTAVNNIGNKIELKIPGNLPEDEQCRMVIAQTLEKYDALKECPEQAPVFGILNHLSSELGERIAKIFQILATSVRPEVEDLQERIRVASEQIISDSGQSIVLGQEAQLRTEFNTISLSKLYDTLGGVDFILSEFKAVTGIEPNRHINDIQTGAGLMRTAVAPVPMTEEARKDCEDRILANIQKSNSETPVSAEDVKNLCDLLFDPYYFQQLVVQCLTTTSNDYATIFHTNLAKYESLLPLVEAARSTPLNLPDDTIEQIHTNIESVLRVLTLIRYSIYAIGEYFAPALVIDHNTVNTDRLNEFMEAGGSKEDIAKYLYVYYTTKNTPVPNTGISKEDILDSKDRVNEEFGRIQSAYEMNAASIKRTALIQAIKGILTDYLEGVDPARLPANTDIEYFKRQKQYLIGRCVNMLDIDDDHHLENCLFAFVIDMWHENTVVQAAHDLFGREMVKQLKLNSDITDEQLNLVDARVAATLAARFIVQNLCIKKKF